MVCPYSLSRPGGVQGQAVGLAASLRQLGHEVVVIAPDSTQARGYRESMDQATYIVGGAVNVSSNGSVAPVSISPLAARRVSRFVRNRRFDVAHLHEPLAPVAGYGLLMKPPVALVGTFHRAGASGWYRLLKPITKLLADHLEVRCAVSNAAESTAREALGGEYEVLFNGVDIERFEKAIPYESSQPSILFLGRHEPRKGLEVLLEAFSERRESAVLWVAGNGPLTDSLMRRFPESSRIKWLGSLTGDEVASRLAGADVLCAPSLGGESFGMVLVEAMASKCSVVASDIPGYRLAASRYARLVEPGNSHALAHALAIAIEEIRTRSGRSSAETLLEAKRHAAKWSMDRLASEYVRIYSMAIERFDLVRSR